jgi:hypothetical protein
VIELRYDIYHEEMVTDRLDQSTNASAIKAVLELKKPRFNVAPAKEVPIRRYFRGPSSLLEWFLELVLD